MTRFVCVTGCAGFIGRVVTRKLLERGDYVYGVDRLDYAAKPDFGITPLKGQLELRPCDLMTLGRLPDVDAVIHLAASTHVDNSLQEGADFVANNVGGTTKMLELVRAKQQHGYPHFIHISTDEVYGPAPAGYAFSEDDNLRPSSPYAASKAAADMLVKAWGTTYDIPYAIVRPTNCYGVGQYPEKLIPKAIRCLRLGRPIPIHGDGTQTRCWLNVEDAAKAILTILDQRLNGVYNVGGNTEATVRDVVQKIERAYLDDMYDNQERKQYGHVRPACDLRYAVNDTKLRAAGWTPSGDLWRDLPQIVAAERTTWRW